MDSAYVDPLYLLLYFREVLLLCCLPQHKKAATFFRHTEKVFPFDARQSVKCRIVTARLTEISDVLYSDECRKKLFAMSKASCHFFALW